VKWRSLSAPRAHNLLKGLLEINEEVECVVEADGDVIRVVDCPESSKHKESEEDETHARDTEEGQDGKPYAGFSQVLEIGLKTFEQGPVKHT